MSAGCGAWGVVEGVRPSSHGMAVHEMPKPRHQLAQVLAPELR